MPTPHTVDIVAVAVVLVGTLIGLRRGLSAVLGDLLGSAAAVGLGVYFYRPFGAWIGDRVRCSAAAADTAAFVATVVAAVLAYVLLKWILGSLMKLTFQPGVDRVGGGIAGFAQAVVIVGTVFVLMNLWPQAAANRMFGKDSLIGRQVKKAMPAVRETLRDLPPGDDGRPAAREKESCSS